MKKTTMLLTVMLILMSLSMTVFADSTNESQIIITTSRSKSFEELVQNRFSELQEMSVVVFGTNLFVDDIEVECVNSNNNRGAYAHYSRSENKIYFFSKLSKADSELKLEVIDHELCHYLQYKYLELNKNQTNYYKSRNLGEDYNSDRFKELMYVTDNRVDHFIQYTEMQTEDIRYILTNDVQVLVKLEVLKQLDDVDITMIKELIRNDEI